MGFALVALGAIVLCSSAWRRDVQDPRYGFTFSSAYTDSLGIDTRETLAAALTDFAPAFVRLPLYWDAVEPVEGEFSWDLVDDEVSRIHEAGVAVHMVIGAKVPRWPECFVPAWVRSHDRDAFEVSLLAYERAVLERYQHAVDVWQVENEPFFAFGDCPAPSIPFFLQEIALVREIDPGAQVQMTVSGEQELWTVAMPFADRIGVSMYRRVRSAMFGSFTFPLSPAWYALMRLPVAPFRAVVLSELQMEPWFTSHPRYLDEALAASYFTPDDALANIAYARAAGFSEVSFWGVEWWYYLREHGYPQLWNTMRDMLTGE